MGNAISRFIERAKAPEKYAKQMKKAPVVKKKKKKAEPSLVDKLTTSVSSFKNENNVTTSVPRWQDEYKKK